MKNLLSLLLFSTLYINSSLQAQIIHISEDFNASSLPSGWTTTAVSGSQSWSFGINASAALAGNSNINGTALAFFDDDVLGGTSLNNTADLLTPTFDNSSFTKTFLEFDYNFYEFNQAADSFMVDVYDGSSWNRVFSRSTNDCGRWTLPICNNNFPRALIDISSFNNANCQVRFRYFDGNDWAFQAAIDNVNIYSLYENDLTISEIIRPFSNCGLSGNDSVEIKIANVGGDTMTNFLVFLDVDNGSQIISDSVQATLLPYDTVNHIFSSTINLSQIGSYQLKAYVENALDTNQLNDTLLQLVSNDTIYNSSYFEDFENPNHGWSVSGTNATWAWGAPSGTLINNAYSGNNAFVTNLNGNYNNSEFSYLNSPCFDFSNYSNDPLLSFRLFSITEINNDYLALEYSTNNGISWSKITRDTSSLVRNWYNNQTLQVWDGITNRNWKRVQNLLRNFSGMPNVKFRFIFQTDGSTNLEGIGIDDFVITEQPSVDLALEDILTDNASANICGLNDLGNIPITFSASNYGTNSIDTIFSFFQVNGGNIYRDTNIQTIGQGQIVQLSTKNRFNFIPVGNYRIKLWIETKGDSVLYNDTLYSDTLNGGISNSYTLPFLENFDQGFTSGLPPVNAIRGWLRFADGNPASPAVNRYYWLTLDRATGSAQTGPDSDATGGFFMFTEASIGPIGSIATLESPCIYIDSSFNNPYLKFLYHRYGDSLIMSDLYIDVFWFNQWIPLDTITGITHTSGSQGFLPRDISLLPYKNQIIKIRFRGISKGCCRGDMAIDDIRIEDLTITTIEEVSKVKDRLLLYPNPNNGSFQIEIGEDLIGEEYYIYNLNGQSIRSGNFKNRNELLDISNEKAGIYFLQVPNRGIHKKVVIY